MEYEIKNDQYITSSTIKNTNSIDAVEGSYYKKEPSEETVFVPFELKTSYSEHLFSQNDKIVRTEYGTDLHIATYKEFYKIYRTRIVDGKTIKVPLFEDKDSFNTVYVSYDSEIYDVYEIIVRKIDNTFLSDVTVEGAEYIKVVQSAIGSKQTQSLTGKWKESRSEEKEVVSATEDEENINLPDVKQYELEHYSWRLDFQLRQIYTAVEDGITFYDCLKENIDFFSDKANKHNPLLRLPLCRTAFTFENAGLNEIRAVGFVVCAMSGFRLNWSAENISILSGLASDEFSNAAFIPTNISSYVGDISSLNVKDAEFSANNGTEYSYRGYSLKSASFSLASPNTNTPKTKYTVTDTNLLTKVSYVQRYNKEDGSLSTYKQPLFAEIADTILSNSNKNKKTTTIEYIGTDNIQTGDTIFFAKDPSTKYIVTKTYLKANPFFVKTIYGRQIL